MSTLSLICLVTLYSLANLHTYVLKKNNKTLVINLHVLTGLQWLTLGLRSNRSGVRFLISPQQFQRLVISFFQLAILPKYRLSSANPQNNQPTSIGWNMNRQHTYHFIIYETSFKKFFFLRTYFIFIYFFFFVFSSFSIIYFCHCFLFIFIFGLFL